MAVNLDQNRVILILLTRWAQIFEKMSENWHIFGQILLPLVYQTHLLPTAGEIFSNLGKFVIKNMLFSKKSELLKFRGAWGAYAYDMGVPRILRR